MASVHPSSRPDLNVQFMPKTALDAIPIFLPVLLGYLLLSPPQLQMSVLGSALPPYRIFLIIVILVTLPRMIGGSFRFAWPDLAVLATTAWISFAMFMTSESEEAFTATVAHFTDIAVAYFFARVAITDLQALRKFLILMLPGLFVFGAILAVEAITHTHIIQGVFSALTGNPVQYGSSPRYGLLRAQGPFPHPILAGVFFLSFLPLYWQSGFKLWPRLAGGFAALCSIFTVSSVALLGIVASLGLLAYNWLSKQIANFTWSLFFFVAGTFIFVAELATKSGTFALFVRYASLNSTSGYNRILIWKYGTQNVAQNPWFGIGYADWVRPSWMGASMDNYWLLTAVRFGVPASVLVGIATLVAALMLMRKSMRSASGAAEAERGVVMSLGVFALSMMSASLWLSAHVWFFMLLGITVSLAQARQRVAVRRQANVRENQSSVASV